MSATRREALAGGAAVAALALLAPEAAQAKQGDGNLLLALMKAEAAMSAAFNRASGPVAAICKPFAAHCDAHVKVLAREIEALTSSKQKPPAVPAGAPTTAAQLATQCTALVGQYNKAFLELDLARNVQLCAGIVANHGQHLALLRRAAGQPALADAFEAG